jgi:hypothetical protein
MKNISERENRSQFEGLHDLLFELAETEFQNTQIILIDKEIRFPQSASLDFYARHMKPDGEGDDQPLIPYYRGH